MSPPLIIDRNGAVAVVTLNRPDKLNALDGGLRRSIIATLDTLAGDGDVRVVVLTGAGRAFCSGLDLDEIVASGESVEANVGAENVVDAIFRFPKPLIGAINGLAVTGGFEIALALDILLVGEAAGFIDSHVRVGIAPGWGLSQRLARAIGTSRAFDLSLSGRTLHAHEAVAWGLANSVHATADLRPAAVALAKRIAAHDPAAVRRMKELIASGWQGTLADGLAREDRGARAANADIGAHTVAERFDALRRVIA